MFDPYLGDVTLTSSAAATVVQDYEKYYDADFSQAVTVTCPPELGYNAINQWVISSNSNYNQVRTPHYTCGYAP